MLFQLALLCLLSLSAVAQTGWHLISRDIGGGPLGVSFFPDGLSGVTATSQILPAGFETKQSKDGGYTWTTVPDQDAFIFGLSNSAAGSNKTAVLSGDYFVQVSFDNGANFSWAVGASAGGEIVRKLFDNTVATPTGFSILGISNDGTNGFVYTREPGEKWMSVNIPWSSPSTLSIDGSFGVSAWTIVGNVYITSAPALKKVKGAVARGRARLAARVAKVTTSPSIPSTAAAYNTEVVISTDQGQNFKTVYTNKSIAALGIACIDALHCVIVSEDADFAYAHTTTDGWVTVRETLADLNEGAALVEVAVAAGVCSNGGDAFIAVGGYVTGAGQSPVWYRSCDLGATWAKDEAPAWPVGGLLNTDIDCVTTTNGTECWTTLWDDSGIDPNGFVSRYFN
jgi:hypothetical protein